MKKLFTHFLALVACLGISMNANAQFTAAFEQEPVGYTVLEKAFPFADIAEALGVDATELGQAIQTWITAEGEVEKNYFFLKTEDGLSDNYTQGGRGGFWMTKNPATPVGWTENVGDDAWYNTLSVDEEVANLVIGVGQHPDAFEAGEEVSAQFVLQYGEKEVTFDVSLKILQGEELPDPVTDLTQLNIVGEKNFELIQYPGGATPNSIDLTGVAEALGTTDEIIADNLDKFLFMESMELKGESSESMKPYKSGTISNVGTATPYPGFWMGAVWDDDLEGLTSEVVRQYWGADPDGVKFDSFRSMYSAGYAYDAATHALSSNTDFENSSLEIGTQYNFDLYIVYGDKAYKLHNVITLTEKPVIDPNEMTEIASEDQEIEFEFSTSTYPGGTMSLDMDAILALLECESSDIVLHFQQDSEGHMTTDNTANNGGSWFDAEGNVSGYALGYFYAEPNAAGDYSTWTIGQYPGKSENGAEYTTKIYFVNGNKYYTVNLKVKITVPDQGEIVPQDQWENVATYNLNATTQPSDGYGVDEYPQIDLVALEEAIGTSSPVFYALKQVEEGETFTKAWNCDPNPGFWMDDKGYSVGWGNNSYVGASYLSDGTFQLFQMPGVNKLGDVWKARLFLVNESNGKYATVNLTVLFGEAVNVEEVATMDVLLPVAHEYIDVDFSEVLPKLGVADVSQILGTNVRALHEDGQWTDLISVVDGIALKADGSIDPTDNGADAVVWLYPAKGDTDNIMTIEVDEGNVAFKAGQQIKTKIAFEVEVAGETESETVSKRVVLNLTFLDKETYDGIDSVNSNKVADGKAYDLSGRRSDMSQKGIYIVGGKKVVK